MRILIVGLCLALACVSRPVTPEKDSVKVSREEPSTECREIGKVTGSTYKIKAKPEEVLEDMKQDAANKGANYIKVAQYSDNHTAVTGIAFDCP